MTLCQEAHPETCRSVDALPGCDCDLCKRVGVGKFWHCVACSCLPCSLAREVERHLYDRAVLHADGSLLHAARPRPLEPYHGEPVTPPQTALDAMRAIASASWVAMMKRVPAAQDVYDRKFADMLRDGHSERDARVAAELAFFAVRDATC